jgi:hypothetical protein
MAKSQPVAKFKLGYVTATVWQNGEHHNTVLPRPTRMARIGRILTNSVLATFSTQPRFWSGPNNLFRRRKLSAEGR